MLTRWPRSEERAPRPAVLAAIEAIVALLEGERTDLSFIDLDMSDVSAFERQVYAAARAIPIGETVTYGELAVAIEAPGAARAVGVALGRNPFPIIVPCHRILAAGGKSGGFSAPGGTDTKFRILRIERAQAGAGGLFDDLPLAVRPEG